MPPAASPGVLKECKALRGAGKLREAFALLRDALRRRQLDASATDAAGRFLGKALSGPDAPAADIRILVLGQCTTSWLATALTAEACAGGKTALVNDGGYDTVIQDLAGLSEDVDVVVLVAWHQRLLAPGDRSGADRIQDELGWLQQAWSMIPASARLVQVGYDSILPGAMGYQAGCRFSGNVRLVREMNAALREHLPESAFFVDLEQVSADAGRSAFYDARNYFWTKQPFSAAGVCHLARHVWSGVRALTTGPKKVLVLDLDNTLWGGVVGEVGPLGVQFGQSPDGEAFRAFQRHVKELGARGIVLAACSKNNPADAREPFEKNPDMVLSLEDFASFEASWDPKPVAIERIARTLSLGLDSFVFFDDNPAEREQVRQQLPEVEVVEVPSDPAEYAGALQAGLWFESVGITDADRQRSEQYRSEERRRQTREAAASLDDYLSSLEMSADIHPVNEENMLRVVQLLAKTNQFNLTTRRHTEEDVRQMLAQPAALGLALRLADRFGDYGLVSVVLGVPQSGNGPPTLRLDTWLMSCRAIGRTVEHGLMNEVAQRARELGYQALVGEYIPTAKNDLVAGFYPGVGFRPVEAEAGNVRQFTLDLTTFEPCNSYVRQGT
jgi:FkbH-like protein